MTDIASQANLLVDTISIKNLIVIILFQLFYEFLSSLLNKSNSFKSKNELELYKKKYSIYKDLYFNLVRNITNNSKINIANNLEALKYLDSLCEFNEKRYDKIFRYLSIDLLECFYNYKAQKLKDNFITTKSEKRIQYLIANDFDKIKCKLGYSSTSKIELWASRLLYPSFFIASFFLVTSIFLVGTNINQLVFVIWKCGNLAGIATIMCCLIKLFSLTKNKG